MTDLVPWPSFDGDLVRVRALRRVLEDLFSVFPDRSGRALTESYGAGADGTIEASNAELVAILHAHGKDRHELPLELLDKHGVFSSIPRDAFG